MEIQLIYDRAVGLKNAAYGGDLPMDQWIPLMDYAMKKGVSLSTLRRHIKSNKIPFKLENGRYLLMDGPIPDVLEQKVTRTPEVRVTPPIFRDDTAQKTIEQLNHELKMAREEIAELKTLIALYEESIPKQRFDV
jgi:hypothetical protein